MTKPRSLQMCFEQINSRSCPLPAQLQVASDLNPAGIRTIHPQLQGLKRDVLLCFDLKVPPDFVPSNNDGEVEEFFLWPLAKVAEVGPRTRIHARPPQAPFFKLSAHPQRTTQDRA